MNETEIQELGNDYIAIHLRLGQAARRLVFDTVALGGEAGITNSQLAEVMEAKLGTGVWPFFSNLPYAMYHEGLLVQAKMKRPNKNGVDQMQTCWRVR